MDNNALNYAYCAGLYEGEGTITTYYKENDTNIKRTIQLKMQMNDRQPLDLFVELSGYGKVYGPYINKNNKLSNNEYYMYMLSNYDQVVRVIERITPWLSERRKDQIVKALDTYEEWEELYGQR